MSFLDFIPVLGNLIDRLIPDKNAQAAAKLEMLKLAQSGELAQLDADLKLAVGQMDVNKAEAGNTSVFVSGWRPFVGWVSAFGLGSQFLFGPFFEWVAALAGHPTPWPQLDMGPLLTMLAGMLGLSGMRMVEKISGVARS